MARKLEVWIKIILFIFSKMWSQYEMSPCFTWIWCMHWYDVCIDMMYAFNTLRLRQNGCLFTDDIFKRIFFNENVWISITISLKFVPKVWINNIPALVQIMAWRRPGDKPLSEPMMVSLLTHICSTRPQWVNYGKKSLDIKTVPVFKLRRNY